MDKTENYDFYKLGKRLATEAIVDLRAKSKQIRKEFGKAAAEDFEFGVANAIKTDEYFYDDYDEIDINKIGGTLDYGMPNERNNSYFGGKGTSKQYVTVDGKEVYNPPKPHKK